VHPVENFDPSFQKPLVFEHLQWGVVEMRVPPISEPRAFEIMFRHISRMARDAGDCHMMMDTRDGHVFLYVPGDQAPVLLK